jgi:ribosome-interacting GTPase 1
VKSSDKIHYLLISLSLSHTHTHPLSPSHTLTHAQTHTTVDEFCRRIHKTLLDQFKHARVWGQSVKHKPQKVGLKHVLLDEDILQIVKKV